MGLFSKILDKLGLKKENDEQPATAGTKDVVRPTSTKPGANKPSGAAPVSSKGVSTTTSVADKRQKDDVAIKHRASPVPAPPQTMSKVDVMTMLEQKARGTGLNWKQSISDLLFLLEIDNSYDARVELAKELDAPQEVMGDSARMNTWLHKTVLQKIADNGGNIPQDLLD